MTHAVVWIDHQEARIFHVHPAMAEESRVLSPEHHVHRHPKGRGEPREHPDDARRFFHEVAGRLEGIDSILVVGPASAKDELITFIHEKHPQLESKIAGVEAADHPTGREIVAHARAYFKAS